MQQGARNKFGCNTRRPPHSAGSVDVHQASLHCAFLQGLDWLISLGTQQPSMAGSPRPALLLLLPLLLTAVVVR